MTSFSTQKGMQINDNYINGKNVESKNYKHEYKIEEAISSRNQQ